YDMFVDLMTDVRKSVASLVFRAQLAVPQPRPQMPRRMVLSGPSDAPGGDPLASPAPRRIAPEPSVEAGVGVAAHASPSAAPSLTGIASSARTDMSRIRTNRVEDSPAARPAAVADKVGRNDPCPCGSGRKYKKCHGAGS